VAVDHVITEASGAIKPLLKMFYTPRLAHSFDDDEEEDEHKAAAEANHQDGDGPNLDLQLLHDRETALADTADAKMSQLHPSTGRYQRSSAKDHAMLIKLRVLHVEAEKWARFDAAIIVVIVLNGLCIGFDLTKEEPFKRNFASDEEADLMESHDLAWMLLEILFFTIYCGEFILRCILYYQMKVAGMYDTFLLVIPAMTFSMTFRTACEIVKIVPKVVRKDIYVKFDLLLILFGVIDNCILRFWFQDMRFLMILRFFRGLRLLRLARVLYLFHELTALMGSIIMSAPVVLWSVVLLAGFIYMNAIFAMTVIRPEIDDGDHPELLSEWKDIRECMITLAKLTTFQDWGGKGKRLAEAIGPVGYFFVLAFVMYAGLGLMNLTTGVIMEAAFRIVSRNTILELEEKNKILRSSAEEAIDKVYRRVTMANERRKADVKSAHVKLLRNVFLLEVWSQGWHLSGRRQKSQYR
jgi:hypothetical protein